MVYRLLSLVLSITHCIIVLFIVSPNNLLPQIFSPLLLNVSHLTSLQLKSPTNVILLLLLIIFSKLHRLCSINFLCSYLVQFVGMIIWNYYFLVSSYFVIICALIYSAFPFLYSTFITFSQDFIIIITPFLAFLSFLHIL